MPRGDVAGVAGEKMRIIKFFIIFFILFFLLIIFGIPAVLIIYGPESHALVMPGEKITLSDAARVRKLIALNDPRKLRAGEIGRVSVTERDLNLFLDYALANFPMHKKISARVDLYSNVLRIGFTLTLPKNPFGKYLNIQATLNQSESTLSLAGLRIGAITIPGRSLNFLTAVLHTALKRFPDYREIAEGIHTIKSIHLRENSLSATYIWRPEVVTRLKQQGRDLLLSNQDQKRLLFYFEEISAASQRLDRKIVSLATFMRPLFQQAFDQSEISGDPVAENRALIITLAMYCVGRNPYKILALNESSAKPGRVNLTLLGRGDLTKHFLISAAITVSAGTGLANLAGVFKELDDSQGGSGFSFADLAADQAGVKLAEAAVESQDKARLLQERMRAVRQETDFMPRIDRLPEGIMEFEFKGSYKDLESKSYRLMEQEIARRIQKCRIYQ